MSASRIRLGNEPIVHGTTSGGWTTCGVMYGPSFWSETPTDDPIDCMACLVQEARSPANTLTVHGVVKLPTPMPIHTITFVIVPEPKK